MTTLWLSPSGDTERAYRSLIEQFARELDTPSFAPHVTLISGWSADAEAATSLVADLAPIELPVRGVTESPDYFRAVVLELEPVPALLELRRRARARVGLSGTDEYRPHLSLVYGEVPVARRERVRAEVARAVPPSVRLGRLDVASTSGAVERWQLVRSVAFGAGVGGAVPGT